MIQNSFFRTLKEYILITVGILIYVIGWSVFLVPNNLIGGGASGIGTIIQYATGGVIKIGYTYFVINAVLLVMALFVIGKGFGMKTVYAMLIVSVGLTVAQDIIPQSIIQSLAIDNGKLMSTIMAGIMVGVGIGISMSQGGSTGGTDIIALMVNKNHNIAPGRMILLMDVVIICSSIVVPSYTASGELLPFAEKITTIVYGLILITVSGTVVDMYLSGTRQSVQIFVFSKKYDEIADAITQELHRGVTVLDGEGWYTKQDVKMVMVMTRKSDLNEFLRTIKTIDPDAFVSVTSVFGVYGCGFDTIKASTKRK